MHQWLAMSVVAMVTATLAGFPEGPRGLGPWHEPPPGTPEPIGPGVISTDAYEWRLALSPDGRTAYFPRSDGFFPITRQATIMVSRWKAGRWTEPEVASFSGVYPDMDPFISPDGQTLHFSSIRPVDGQERTDAELWRVRRTPGGGWGEPEHLGAVNSPADELYSSVSAAGTLYFASERAGGLGGWDIYRARPRPGGGYGPAENVGAPVNTAGWEFNPAITPNERTLLFTGLDRDGGAGYGDIWASRRLPGGWSEPAGVGPIVNTAADEYHPSLSPARDRLFYVAGGDIHQVAVDALDLYR
jgi:hypothetical protein